jgi:hypothetical protein
VPPAQALELSLQLWLLFVLVLEAVYTTRFSHSKLDIPQKREDFKNKELKSNDDRNLCDRATLVGHVAEL